MAWAKPTWSWETQMQPAGAFMKHSSWRPTLPDLREALAEASAMTEGRGPSDASALMEQNRALLAGAASADERFEILGRIGRLQREN